MSLSAFDLLPVATLVVLLALWAYALLDLAQRPEHAFPPLSLAVSNKTFWAAIVLFLSGAGALAYYVMVMRRYPRDRY